jgi:hypothetical protein
MDIGQIINMLAIELLDKQGFHEPSQIEIDQQELIIKKSISPLLKQPSSLSQPWTLKHRYLDKLQTNPIIL